MDWRTLDLSGYLEALEAHNEAHSPEQGDKEPAADLDRLARFHRAHKRDGGNAKARAPIASNQGAQSGRD